MSDGNGRRWYDNVRIIWALLGVIAFMIVAWGAFVFNTAHSATLKNVEQDGDLKAIILKQDVEMKAITFKLDVETKAIQWKLDEIQKQQGILDAKLGNLLLVLDRRNP